jgi:putative phage-type endonuclease
MTYSDDRVVEIPGALPGSAEWLQYMTGSKIAAVMGLSPYESRFSLHLRMQGRVEGKVVTDEMQRGHYLEPAIRAWFCDQHPGWGLHKTGMLASRTRDLHAVSPDGLITADRGELRLFEAKSAMFADEWGEPGSGEIPIGYRCQVMWGMDLLGVKVAHVAVLTGQLTFVEYVVEYDADDAALLRKSADDFLAELAAGERPDIDGHSETYEVIKAMHPEIAPMTVEVPEDLFRLYCQSKAAVQAAEFEARRATSLVADHMGRAQRAVFAGRALASRQAKKGGTPYVVAARSLPNPSAPTDLEVNAS